MSGDVGILELIDLRRSFGSTVALDGLSFTVPPGEVFGFLGPNGAGKTTAMRAILRRRCGGAALVDISVWLGTRSPGRRPPDQRRAT
jgi:ABC-2 type transport system ATP-binding protein